MRKVNQKSLEKMVEYWQEILRLQDWDVKIKVHPHSDFKDGNVADIQMKRLSKRAYIRISDIHFREGSVETVEDTVVHELLHLHFNFLDDDNLKHNDDFVDLGLEQALEAIGPALFELSRLLTKKSNKEKK